MKWLFELYESLSDITTADIFQRKGEKKHLYLHASQPLLVEAATKRFFEREPKVRDVP